MAWRGTFDNSDWIVVSKRKATNVDRYPIYVSINGVLILQGFGTVTKAAVTVTSESRSYTLAAAESGATAVGDAMTKNAQGDITYQRTVEVLRQNDADAYKVVKTEMTVTITV
jgi:hypothetical protein